MLLPGLLKQALPRIAVGVEEFLNIEPVTFANNELHVADEGGEVIDHCGLAVIFLF